MRQISFSLTFGLLLIVFQQNTIAFAITPAVATPTPASFQQKIDQAQNQDAQNTYGGCPVCPPRYRNFVVPATDSSGEQQIWCCASLLSCNSDHKPPTQMQKTCPAGQSCNFKAGIGCQGPAEEAAPPCINNTKGDEGKNGCLSVQTALGPISTDPTRFIKSLFSIVLGLSGGMAVLIIIFSGFQFMTSRGDDKVIQEARDRITASIIGILFIIFSFIILQVIGVDILHIPGISK